MIARWVLTLALAGYGLAATTDPDPANPDDTSVSLESVSVADLHEMSSTTSGANGSQVVTTYSLVCDDSVDEACPTRSGTCERDGATGTYYFEIRDDAIRDTVCLTQGTAMPDVDVLARAAFRRLSWPESRLVVQPPGGRTLVNFDTLAYTTNDRPTMRTVRLLGQRVTVEATPVAYRWRWGDGETTTTSEPGRAYPHLDITHRYQRVGRVQVRLDTTYRGRFRLGRGAWQPIPETLTVTGTPQALAVVEAAPVLVDAS